MSVLQTYTTIPRSSSASTLTLVVSSLRIYQLLLCLFRIFWAQILKQLLYPKNRKSDACLTTKHLSEQFYWNITSAKSSSRSIWKTCVNVVGRGLGTLFSMKIFAMDATPRTHLCLSIAMSFSESHSWVPAIKKSFWPPKSHEMN